jgi:hypothetical protein
MDDEQSGAVKREVVLEVLRAHGVSVTLDTYEETPHKYLMIKGDIIQSVVLPDFVIQRMIHRLQYKYEIEIHLFYHPEMIPPRKEQA